MWGRLIDHFTRDLAFYPPSPPSYQLARHNDEPSELYIQPLQAGIKRVVRAQVMEIPVGSGRHAGSIVAAFVPAPSGRRCTLLHSHGNAVDLGQMLPIYEQLARVLNVNVMGYDYRGYGVCGGLPGAAATLDDISAVFTTLLDTFARRPEDIVLYGQSVGSGPTSWLAARTPGLAGVVLHAPFLSGIRVLNPTLRRWPSTFDIFPNLKYVPKVTCPVLIMHGTEDEVIDIDHGRKLHALCRHPSEPFWADGCGHQDVEGHPRFIARLREFLKEVSSEYR